MKSKMENPTKIFREKVNLVLQFTEELQTKSKTVMSVEACERKKVFFVTFILSEEIFFIICAFSQYIKGLK